jgi:hypothetical protein
MPTGVGIPLDGQSCCGHWHHWRRPYGSIGRTDTHKDGDSGGRQLLHSPADRAFYLGSKESRILVTSRSRMGTMAFTVHWWASLSAALWSAFWEGRPPSWGRLSASRVPASSMLLDASRPSELHPWQSVQCNMDREVDTPRPPRSSPSPHACPVCETVHTGQTCPRCGRSAVPHPITLRARRRMQNE